MVKYSVILFVIVHLCTERLCFSNIDILTDAKQPSSLIQLSKSNQERSNYFREYVFDKLTNGLSEEIKATLDHSNGLFGLLNLNKRPLKRIVIFTLNPFLGDVLITQFSLIPAFHKYFPNSEIVVLSPNSHILNAKPWLNPIKIDLSIISQTIADDIKNEGLQSAVKRLYFSKEKGLLLSEHTVIEEIFSMINPHLSADTLLYFDNGSIEQTLAHLMPETDHGTLKLDIYLGNLSTRLNSKLEELLKTKSAYGVWHMFNGIPANVIFPRNHSTPLSGYYNKRALTNTYDINRNFPDTGSVYQNAFIQSQIYFGENSGFGFPKDLFLEFAPIERLERFFKSKGIDPKKKFIFLNFNTKANYKAIEALPKLESLYKKVIAHITELYPEYNIVITPIEKIKHDHADQIYQSIENHVENHSTKVSFLPKDVRITDTAIREAHAVITFDSGLNHLACNIIRDPSSVLVLGFKDPKILSGWKHPNQPSIMINELIISNSNQDTLSFEGISKLNKLLKRRSSSACESSPDYIMSLFTTPSL